MMSMMNETHVNRPAADVWREVGDPARWHRWRGAMDAPAEKLDGGPIAAGSVYDYRSSFMGRVVEAQIRVMAYEPERQIVVTTDKPLAVRLSFRCEANGEGTRVVQETQGDAPGFFGMAEPLLAPLMKRRFQQDLEALRELAAGLPR